MMREFGFSDNPKVDFMRAYLADSGVSADRDAIIKNTMTGLANHVTEGSFETSTKWLDALKISPIEISANGHHVVRAAWARTVANGSTECLEFSRLTSWRERSVRR